MKNLSPLSQAPIYFSVFPHYSPKSPLDFHLRLMAVNRHLCIFSAVFWTFSSISLIILFIQILLCVHLVFSMFCQCLKGIIKSRANQQINRLSEDMATGQTGLALQEDRMNTDGHSTGRFHHQAKSAMLSRDRGVLNAFVSNQRSSGKYNTA